MLLVHPPKGSSTLTSNAMCIDLDRKWKDRLALIPRENIGVATERRDQSTAGICKSPVSDAYEISALLFDTKRMIPGRYYFDYHHIDGNVQSSEVITCK